MQQLHYLLAFSGGLDSTVLLYLLANALKNEPHAHLSAIHIHHGLQSVADDWVVHCQTVCDAWQVPLTVVYVNAKAIPGESPEAAARTARYLALEQHMSDKSILVTGHHQDDQAETFFLQLLRGAGTKGLSAMAEWKKLKAGWHYRPLLNYTRQQLEHVAVSLPLSWIEDPSNQSRAYARNALRHDVLPTLRQYWPQYAKTLSRSAQLLAESHELLSLFAEEQLTALGATADCLPLAAFRQYTAPRQALLLRTWLEAFKQPLPSQAKLQQFLHDLLNAEPDRHPSLNWAGLTLYRYRDTLQWRRTVTTINRPIRWPQFPETLILDDHRTLQVTHTIHGGLRTLSAEEIATLSVRYWQTGGRFHPATRAHSQRIKKLLQEWCIPLELRHSLPFLYCGDTLIAIIGYGIAKTWQSDTAAWQLHLNFS